MGEIDKKAVHHGKWCLKLNKVVVWKAADRKSYVSWLSSWVISDQAQDGEVLWWPSD